jgi:molybdate transport system regulatory protein
MNKNEKNPFSDINLNYKIWLSTTYGESIMGDGKWQMLKAIEKHGSLMAATEAMGLTYRKTWDNLKKIENVLGVRLLDKSRGGTGGGTTSLTPEGKKLVRAFDLFHKKYDKLLNKAFEEFKSNLIRQDV